MGPGCFNLRAKGRGAGQASKSFLLQVHQTKVHRCSLGELTTLAYPLPGLGELAEAQVGFQGF